MKHSIKIFSLTIGLLFLLQSCVSKKNILYLQDIDSYNDSEVLQPETTLQTNDILKIDIGAFIPEAALPYNKAAQSGGVMGTGIDMMQLDGYLVSKNKTINFPVLGEISVAEKTIPALEADIKSRLKTGEYLINPSVTVRLLNAKITILGEVNNPGTYTFTENNITLLQALGLAGDLTINGNREDVILIRETNGKRSTTHLNLTESRWLNSPYQNIHPNDVILVNQNEAKVKSAGLVGNLSSLISLFSVILSSIILITK